VRDHEPVVRVVVFPDDGRDAVPVVRPDVAAVDVVDASNLDVREFIEARFHTEEVLDRPVQRRRQEAPALVLLHDERAAAEENEHSPSGHRFTLI